MREKEYTMTERVQKTLEFLTDCFEKSSWFAENPKDKAYRLEHSIRVANICGEISRKEGMDEELCMIAGLLHDVAYGTAVDTEGYDWKEHGRDSARIARPFLEALSLPEQTINDICYGIAIHVDDKADFEGCRCPFTETVGDADNIDRFDVWRIYESVRYQAQFEEKTHSEKMEWLTQRLESLEKLGKMEFSTPTATEMWREKVEFQTLFFERLKAQMELNVLA